MIKIKINNICITAEPNTRIITIADQYKITIPRFCYHPELSVVANCRMCLIEVVDTPKLLPACATYATDGMQILTNSAKVIAAQQGVLELLSANHPLDCPWCEKAGECELQDLTVQYGKDRSSYTELKRKVATKDFSALIATNMTRCIHCTRCVRFAKEIAGVPELGAIYRGENMQITNCPNEELTSEVAGNMIDLCPVGALIAKPNNDFLRAWELNEKPGISCHDCVGSKIYYHVKAGQIKRAVPQPDPDLNSLWLADRDRFGFHGINSADRLKHPLINKQGKWYLISWQEALEFVKLKLTKIIEQFGVNQIGGLISPNATLEECLLFQKFLKNLGCNNIDHRLRQLDFRWQNLAPSFPNLGLTKITELCNQQFILLIGTYLNKEQPIAALYVRKAALAGSKVAVINPVDFDFNFPVDAKVIPMAGDLITPLLQVLKAVVTLKKVELDPAWNELLKHVNYSKIELKVAEQLLAVPQGTGSIILGALAISHPEYSGIIAISNLLCQLTSAKFGVFSDGANSAGAWLAGCTNVHTKNGLNAYEMLNHPLKAYLLLGIEPELDSALGSTARHTLAAADLVIAMTAFESEYLFKYADLLLPIATPQETGGTYINITGLWQTFEAVASQVGDSRPATTCLIELAKYFEQDFSTLDLNQLLLKQLRTTNIKLTWGNFVPTINPRVHLPINTLIKIAPVALYAVDPIVRRAKALQHTIDAEPLVLLSVNTAHYLNLVTDQAININSEHNPTQLIQVKVKISVKVPDGCILIKQVDHNTLIGMPYSRLNIVVKIDQPLVN